MYQHRVCLGIRAATGLQDFVGTAPLNLVDVAHGERMTDVSPEERRLYASGHGLNRPECLSVLRSRRTRERFSRRGLTPSWLG
jgi:hypothetical protein